MIDQGDKYIRKAVLIKILDGDTIQILFDLGFNVRVVEKIRLARVNCQERNKNYTDWLLWKKFTIKWFETVTEFWIKTNKDKTDPYARYIGEVIDSNGRSLVDDLIKAGCPLYTGK
jgi:phosphoserine aminotransferase